MTKTRDLVAEIEEIRQRRGIEIYPVMIPFRMINIARAFRSSPALDPEFLRYVPIGTVACIEGFFRSAVKECIDAGSQFRVAPTFVLKYNIRTRSLSGPGRDQGRNCP